jgi:hypothetical protein
MARPKSAITEYEPITIRIPAYIMADMRNIAEAEDRSLNQQIVRVVKSWHAEHRKRSEALLVPSLPPGETPCADVALTS